MQLTRRHTLTGLALVAAACVTDARAAWPDLPIETQGDDYVFQLFNDVDDIEVITHQNVYRVALENETELRIGLAHQTVVIPAVEAPPGSDDAVDAITTASRPIRDIGDAYREYARTRKEVQFDVSRPELSVGYYFSTEEDYLAQMIRTQWNRDFAGETFNLSVGASFGWDTIDPLADADSRSVSDHRHTTYANVVVTRVLTPTTVVRAGYETFFVDGLQHNPYRNVYVAGGNETERHPDDRHRQDVYLRLNQYLPLRASLKLEAKLYGDDWGVRSTTLGARLSQYVGDALIVRYRYRYYDQSAADFHSTNYTTTGGIGGYRTADYRLSAFDAHLFGTRVHWSLRDLIEGGTIWNGLALQLGYERYFNSNNFSANILEAGVSLDF
ncbi:MAG TPA: DUF3570 domain-containing protein [Candidatus Krumholzibacteria bacterium]|nr:DUF3570 domain-containing protein [Candidatus Krumholzibacteria bacterium]